jgi:hypothetical protein
MEQKGIRISVYFEVLHHIILLQPFPYSLVLCPVMASTFLLMKGIIYTLTPTTNISSI